MLLAGTITSCDMDAPNQSSLEGNVVGYTYKLADAAVMGIHQSFGETNSYRGRFLPYYGLNTDVEVMISPSLAKTPDGDKNDLCAYNATPTNKQMNTENNAYAKFYEGIERANKAIKDISQYGSPETRKDMGQLLGEAMTLRAVLYLDLIKGWGDVPYRFEPLTNSTIYKERVDRDTIYKRLLADLKTAEDLVYWPKENTITMTTERVNKAFVKGLRARIALYAGGYSQRADGTIRLSNDPALSREKMYQIAKEECESIIKQNCNKLGAFEDNFKKLCRDDISAGDESLWEIPFSDGRGRVLFTFGVKHQHKDQYTDQNRGGVNGPLPTLYYDYDVQDLRRDITCVPYQWSNSSNAVQELWSTDKWCFGKLRYEWMKRRVTSTNDDGVNWQYMRLADVYLMLAEAINELEGPANAAQYMEPVLSRVLPTAKVSALMAKYTVSKDAFFQGIVEQRKLEFAGEMLRKADLIRWNMLDEKMAEAKSKLKDLRTRSGQYADLPENVYTKLEGETLKIYGLNHGDTDEEGAALPGYTKVKRLSEDKIKDDYIDGLYVGEPSKHQYWPIWQTFVDKSNNTLDNKWLGF